MSVSVKTSYDWFRAEIIWIFTLTRSSTHKCATRCSSRSGKSLLRRSRFVSEGDNPTFCCLLLAGRPLPRFRSDPLILNSKTVKTVICFAVNHHLQNQNVQNLIFYFTHQINKQWYFLSELKTEKRRSLKTEYECNILAIKFNLKSSDPDWP